MLSARFGGHVVSLDDLTRPGTPTWEHDRFVDELLTPLRAGREARYRRWRWDMAAPGEELAVPTGGLVIVEGVSALTRAVTDRVGRWWDVALWVDCDEAIRRRRIRERDGDALAETWARDWWPSEQRYLSEERPDLVADFVVAG